MKIRIQLLDFITFTLAFFTFAVQPIANAVIPLPDGGYPWGKLDGVAVLVDSLGKLGVQISSRRFKEEIQPMDKASEVILALKPVTFHYKSDAKNTACFGLAISPCQTDGISSRLGVVWNRGQGRKLFSRSFLSPFSEVYCQRSTHRGTT